LQSEVARIQSSTTFNTINVFGNSDIVFQIGPNNTPNDRLNMPGTPLITTMSLGSQTITDKTNFSAYGDISATIAFASAVSGASVSSVSNAAIDAINNSQ
jgi:hypothetical protein